MRFNLETSELLYEVKYSKNGHPDIYTYEYLYRNTLGKYFIHYEGGRCSEYAVKVGFTDYAKRSGNYYINNTDISLWKHVSRKMAKRYPLDYIITDWEKERNDSLILNEIYIPEEKLLY